MRHDGIVMTAGDWPELRRGDGLGWSDRHPVDRLPAAGSYPGCRGKVWVPITYVKTRARFELEEFERAGGFFSTCGKCDNCIANKVKDWQGRMIGEAAGSEYCYFVTLTVGGDKYLYARGKANERALSFHKDDVRAYVKRLKEYQRVDWLRDMKSKGLDPLLFVRPSLRYFYVGEKGDQYQRVHYHLALFMNGAGAPAGVPFDVDFFHGRMAEGLGNEWYPLMPRVPGSRTYWPWGWSCWKAFDGNKAAYIAGYINKQSVLARGSVDGSIMRPGITTKPLLSGLYFEHLARSHVDNQLPLLDRRYTVPAAPGYTGPLRKFFMNRSSAKLFVLAGVRDWCEAHEERPHEYRAQMPESPLVRRYFQQNTDREFEIAAIGGPERALERASFLRVMREREAGIRERQLSVEELLDSDLLRGGSKRAVRLLLSQSRTTERVASMGNRKGLID